MQSQLVITAEANGKEKSFPIGTFDLTSAASPAIKRQAIEQILEGNPDTIAAEMRTSIGEAAQAIAYYLHTK